MDMGIIDSGGSLSVFFESYGGHQGLHLSIRRQRQICIRDRMCCANSAIAARVYISGHIGVEDIRRDFDGIAFVVSREMGV